MSLKNKINQRLTDSSNWILDSPKSLVILMIMATSMSFIFFGLLSYVMGINENWFLVVLFGIFSLLSLKQCIKISRMVKKVGLKDALGGICAREFVWHKDKFGKKIGGVEDENKRTKQTDEVCDKQNAGCNEVGKKGNGTDNSESERTNAWSRIMLERIRSDVDKDGVSKGGNA